MASSLICEIGGHPFSLSEADVAAYKKFDAQPLRICFPHQHQWRLSFRNDRFLHRRTCDLTGKSIVSMYPQDAPYKVYEREAWFSDRFDPLAYGRPFDFNRPFFEQYMELQLVVPRMALVNVGAENSEYCNMCINNKNCYLIFGGDINEDSLYGSLPMFCRDCVDCDWTDHCELCYFCGYSKECYACRFTFFSKNCSNSAFIENCTGCNDCIMCFDLQNKQYHIENKPYTREAYIEKRAQLLDGSYQTQQDLWQTFLKKRQQRIVKYATIINSENCTGELIFNSKNCTQVFECTGGEECRELMTSFNVNNSFNSDYLGQQASWSYNTLSPFGAYNVMCSFFTISSSDIAYSEAINFSKNVFGSIGLKHNDYVIFNTKYSPEEYALERAKIVEHMKKTGEWGRYFPKKLSTFPYNESTASFFFPRTYEAALRECFRWSDEAATESSEGYQIPDNIREVPDSILDQPITCETSGKSFRVIPQELAFYRNHNIPIPRRHSDQRYRDRLALRNSFELFERKCAKCALHVKSSYSPDRPERIYCEKCYLQTVF